MTRWPFLLISVGDPVDQEPYLGRPRPLVHHLAVPAASSTRPTGRPGGHLVNAGSGTAAPQWCRGCALVLSSTRPDHNQQALLPRTTTKLGRPQTTAAPWSGTLNLTRPGGALGGGRYSHTTPGPAAWRGPAGSAHLSQRVVLTGRRTSPPHRSTGPCLQRTAGRPGPWGAGTAHVSRSSFSATRTPHL